MGLRKEDAAREREKLPTEKVESMLRRVPPRKIIISFDGKPGKSLEEYIKERTKREKPCGKKKKTPQTR